MSYLNLTEMTYDEKIDRLRDTISLCKSAVRSDRKNFAMDYCDHMDELIDSLADSRQELDFN